jgi:hypothetical protein
MAKVWQGIVQTKGSDWGIPANVVTELGQAVQNAEAIPQLAKMCRNEAWEGAQRL